MRTLTCCSCKRIRITATSSTTVGIRCSVLTTERVESRRCLSSQKLLPSRSPQVKAKLCAKSCSTASRIRVIWCAYRPMRADLITIQAWGNPGVVNGLWCTRTWCVYGRRLAGRSRVSASQPQALCRDLRQKGRKRARSRNCRGQERIQTLWSHNRSIISSLFPRKILVASREKMSLAGAILIPLLNTISGSIPAPRNLSTEKAFSRDPLPRTTILSANLTSRSRNSTVVLASRTNSSLESQSDLAIKTQSIGSR